MAVTEINLGDCYLCATSGFMLGMSTPESVYYGGPTDEGQAEALAAAEAERAKSQAAYPGLTFTVHALDDYLYAKARDDRAEGAQQERER
jgi:hypothetical protein